MADLLKAYSSSSQTTSRKDLHANLQSVVDALPFVFDQKSRAEFIQLLINDLRTIPNGRLTSKDALIALTALKHLGKNPTGSEGMASAPSLSSLLAIAQSLIKDDPDAAHEALRCVANTLLLHEDARGRLVSKMVNGGDICATMLDKAVLPDTVFILARILFLSTASQSPFIVSLVEAKRNGKGTFVDILSQKLDAMLVAILSGTKMAREAMTDLLKLTFNILLHYPKMVESEPQNNVAESSDTKVLGDWWSPKLEGLLPPLLRLFHGLPPTFPHPLVAPLTHVIHSLISIPINSSTRPIWFPPRSSNSPPRTSESSHSSRKGSRSPPQIRTSTSSSIPTSTSGDSAPITSSSSRSDSPVSHSPTSRPTKTLDKALSVLSRSISHSRSTSPNPQRISTLSNQDTFLHVHDLLEVSFSHYFPGVVDVDDPSIRNALKDPANDPNHMIAEGTTLDDILSPICVLMTRFCQADESCRIRCRQWLVPPDMDRSSALEAKDNMLGRCLRLMQSVYHPRLKDSVGELLYAMCDSDPTTLCGFVGYGNVAGFLFNKGIMSAPTPTSTNGEGPSLTTPDGKAINPITGTTLDPHAQGSVMDEMTEEEREREMEKLFVLFDRLERSGALPPEQNPVRKAINKSQMVDTTITKKDSDDET